LAKKKRRISRHRYPSKRFFKERRNERNYDDPRYIAWRKEVFKRDGYECVWPNCPCKHRLQAHHIRRWADFPSLRFVVSNGATLCPKHHKMVYNKEDAYAATFDKILEKQLKDKLNGL